MTDRQILRISGTDRSHFLQGLITNDIARAERDGIIYAALLTPQGKYLADFFVVSADDAFLIDVAASHSAMLMQRLAMYRLRAEVDVAPAGLSVATGPGAAPEGALPDPRHAALGWRAYGTKGGQHDTLAARVAHIIPETGVELGPDSYILECGFERLNGVDFRKGCYVGQEVTARMKHKTELKKGLRRVLVGGQAEIGTAIVTEDGKEAGALFSQHGGAGIAYLRFDRARGVMQAGTAQVRLADD